MPVKKLPIIYVRGYAGTQSDVEEAVDDPFYGFNLGSTHIRLDISGKADFFAFQSPLVRLARDHGYSDVFDGAIQSAADLPAPNQSVWIYRYYDPTSNTFDRPGGRRLSIEEAANGLAEFIDFVISQTQSTGANKVFLVAHSMGGLVCRSLIQKIYPERGIKPAERIDRLFTYGTPHGGISFDLGFGVIEKVRDLLGVNQSDDFGPDRMYRYLTPAVQQMKDTPKDWQPRDIPADVFDPERVFCIVGTDAHDYEVVHGLSRSLVGPQSDGLVQIENASVSGAPRAFIHRSHSGRYGMVNSEEGYQNLQRFLFGDVKVNTILSDFELDFNPPSDLKGAEISYQFEVQVAVRGLLILIHDRSLAHYCAIPLNQRQYQDQKTKGGLPLFTNFLLANRRPEGTMRYMIRIGVYSQLFQKGFLFSADHIERLPLWSDYLVAELRPSAPGRETLYDAFYCWASESREPKTKMLPTSPSERESDLEVALPERGRSVLGKNAKLRFWTFLWG